MSVVKKRVVDHIRELVKLSTSGDGEAPENERLAQALHDYRQILQKGANAEGATAAERLNRSRFAQRKASELTRELRRGKRVPLAKRVLVATYGDSPLLDGLLPDRRARWKAPLARRAGKGHGVTLSSLNFIERPAETLKAFKALAELECTAPAAQIHFDDEFCSDISPFLALAEIWPQMAPIFRGGRMGIPLQKVVAAVGLADALRMRLRGLTDLDDVWAFKLRRRRPTGTSLDPDRELQPQKKEQVADQFCDALSRWLGQGDFDLELTDTGKSNLAAIITELLDNAERHSDLISHDGSWSCAAFMARRNEGGTTVYRCHMAFLSVGATFAESLATAPDKILNDVVSYSRQHQRKGQSAETLTTLFALQDTVTCDPEALRDGRGGIGLQRVLEFVSELSDMSKLGRDPRLTIISGNSCIKLRMPYFLGTRADPLDPRVTWFNARNTPTEPPDPEYVFDLDDRFAGTIVGISFVVDLEYMRAVLDGNDQSDAANEERPGQESGRS